MVPTFTSKAALIAALKNNLKTSDAAALKALLKIYSKQTNDEQVDGQTEFYNGVGFNGYDAPFMSDLVERYHKYGSLTKGQYAALHKGIAKYAGQLIELALVEGTWKKEKGVYTFAAVAA